VGVGVGLFAQINTARFGPQQFTSKLILIGRIDAAPVHTPRAPSPCTRDTTAMDGGSADFAGAKVCPFILNITLRVAPALSGYRPSMGIKKAACYF